MSLIFDDDGNMIVPAGSPVFNFLMSLQQDIIIGSMDELQSSREIIRRVRYDPTPSRHPAFLIISHKFSPKQSEQEFKISADVKGDRGIAWSNEIDELSMSDIEALFEGLGKAILKFKYRADL